MPWVNAQELRWMSPQDLQADIPSVALAKEGNKWYHGFSRISANLMIVKVNFPNLSSPRRRGSSHYIRSSYKSFHRGFISSISLIFHFRFHFFNCLSLFCVISVLTKGTTSVSYLSSYIISGSPPSRGWHKKDIIIKTSFFLKIKLALMGLPGGIYLRSYLIHVFIKNKPCAGAVIPVFFLSFDSQLNEQRLLLINSSLCYH